MLLACSRVQAVFAGERIGLEAGAAAQSVWDEHGGIFVVRLEGLVAVELPASPGEARITAEIKLAAAESLISQIKEFAAQQSLPLTAAPGPPGELLVEPFLSACHLPGRSLFLFCEAPQLQVRLAAPQTLELMVTGSFQARRVPCRETDIIIHLRPGAMAQVLSFILRLAPTGQ